MSVPLCSNCGRPLLKFDGSLFSTSLATDLKVPLLCNDCSNRRATPAPKTRVDELVIGGVSLKIVAPGLFRLLEPSINPALFESFEGEADSSFLRLFRNSQTKAVAALALVYSIQQANSEGVFSRPANVMKTAMRVLLPRFQRSSLMGTSVRNFLIKKGLWVPFGPQKRGVAGRANQMQLTENVRDLLKQFKKGAA